MFCSTSLRCLEGPERVPEVSIRLLSLTFISVIKLSCQQCDVMSVELLIISLIPTNFVFKGGQSLQIRDRFH